MTNGQQRAHKFIWIAMVITLPLLIFASIRHLSFDVQTTDISVESNSGSSALVVEQDWIRTAVVDKNDETLLQIRLKKPLKTPSALVYTLDQWGNKDQLLGQLQGIGNYEFPLNTSFEGILVYDAIKEQEIEKLEFSWD